MILAKGHQCKQNTTIATKDTSLHFYRGGLVELNSSKNQINQYIVRKN